METKSNTITFCEKIDLQLNFSELQKDVFKVIEKLGKPKIQAKEFKNSEYGGFGGWSVLSRTGSWQDGWEFGHVVLKQIKELVNQNEFMRYKVMKYLDISHSFEHKNNTEACVGEIQKTIDKIEQLGFYPRRVRISVLQARKESDYHRDAPEGEYMIRLHIPIKTNDKCFYISEGHSINMLADGSAYIIDTSKWHQIKNESNEDRYHIIMDCWDTKHLTKNMKFYGNIQDYENQAKYFRQKIDSVNLTSEDLEYFDSIKKRYLREVSEH
jgi:hypothetical protein